MNWVSRVGAAPYRAAMTRLEPDEYLDHVRRESARFREVLASCRRNARVPACPEWDAADLLWHLAGVQWFWSRVVQGAGPDDVPDRDRPEDYADLLATYDESSAALVDALAAADPAAPAWTWSTEQTVGFILRRQAHEALIHRLDAEQAADHVTELDARLASDGVLEALDVMYGGTPEWGSFTPGDELLRVDCIDTDDHVWVRLGRFTGTSPDSGASIDEADIAVVADAGGEPDCVVAGPAAALDAWLWRRGDDAQVDVAGDRSVYGSFRAIVDQPIN